MCVLVILHLETGVAYSRNSLPSLRGRPSASLLDRGLSERAGVLKSCINPSPFLLRLQLPPSSLPVLAPALLAILGLASAMRPRLAWSARRVASTSWARSIWQTATVN
jgi:hypothetical protein